MFVIYRIIINLIILVSPLIILVRLINNKSGEIETIQLRKPSDISIFEIENPTETLI